jgi:iron complex outermembrane receptor protein
VRTFIRESRCFGSVAAIVLTFALGSTAANASPKSFSIDSEEAPRSLLEFGRQSALQILFASAKVKGIVTNAVRGDYEPIDALHLLLNGTPLVVSEKSDGVLVVEPQRNARRVSNFTPVLMNAGENIGRPAQTAASSTSTQPYSETTQQNNNPSSRPSGAADSEQAGLSEIVVTAQKKTERLQDVPVAVTVLNTDALANNSLNRVEDYFAMVPGLSLSVGSQGGGTQTLVIRGINTGDGTNPTVGVVIDDVPYGNSTTSAFGSFLYPDIDPSDLASIEVLKGPQGTLYGSDSLGGLIKFVYQDPSTDAFSGRLQVLGESVDHGGLGYALRGSVNIPLSDTLAIRASGFTRRDAGYIENITTGQREINQADIHGGHFSALWRPSDAVSLKLGALVQTTDGNGSSVVDTNSVLQPTLGDLQQTGIRGNGEYHSQIQLYTAALKAKLGGVDFVSLSGYGINKWSALYDISVLAPIFAAPYFGVSGATEPNYMSTKKLTQEFRLSSSIGHRLDWMAGVFYTHEESGASYQNLEANDFITGSPVGQLIHWSYSPNTLSEYALFTDVTVHVTDRFDVQVGGRESTNKQTYNEVATGLLVPTFYGVPSPYVQGLQKATGNAFTYLVTPEYKFSPDLMTYVRVATGYRVGGPNITYPSVNTPASYSPDRTTNYELGIKGNVFHHALTFDVSAYYISWQNIQLGATTVVNGAAFGYNTNGGTAKSLGLELSVEAHPIDGMTISAVTSVANAVLTQNLPPESTSYGLAGQRLPYNSHFTGSLTVDQDIVHIKDATAFVGGSLSYVGLRLGEFNSGPTPPQLQMPAFTTINLHTGARYKSWLINLFANNVADKRGITGYSFYDGASTAAWVATIIPPRTVGLSVSKSF